MNKIDEFITSSAFVLVFLYGATFSILSFGEVMGGRITIGFIGVCVVLMVVKVVFISQRRRKRFTKILNAAVLFSILAVYANGLGQVNADLSRDFEEENPNLAEKTRLLVSKFKQVKQHKEMEEWEKDGVVFFYEKHQEEKVKEMSTMLKENKKIWDAFLGETDERLAIQLTDDSRIKVGIGERSGERGAFYSRTSTIYVNSKDEELEYVLHHEYVHFRIYAYQPTKGEEKRIPQWFNEGLADSSALSGDLGFMRLPKMEQVIPFERMNNNKEFHSERKKGTDTYEQSFVMVRKLINDYSWQEVVDLSKAKDQQEFYKNLEKLTGKTMNQLEESIR